MPKLYDKVKHNRHCNSSISQQKKPNQTQAHSIHYCIPVISIFSCYAPFNNWAKKSIIFKIKFQQKWVQYDYSVVQCYITMGFKILH